MVNVYLYQKEQGGEALHVSGLLISTANTREWQNPFLYRKSYFDTSESGFAYQTTKKKKKEAKSYVAHSLLMLRREMEEVYFYTQPKIQVWSEGPAEPKIN